MNKDLLKDPCSDALNPSLSKEGNALFIVGGIRWIKRCSWWGWRVASVCVCVCVSVTTCGLDDIQSGSVFIVTSLPCARVCVCAGWVAGRCPALPSPVSTCELNHEEIEGKFYLFLFFFHRAFHVLTDECVYWLRNENQFQLVSQIIQLY